MSDKEERFRKQLLLEQQQAEKEERFRKQLQLEQDMELGSQNERALQKDVGFGDRFVKTAKDLAGAAYEASALPLAEEGVEPVRKFVKGATISTSPVAEAFVRSKLPGGLSYDEEIARLRANEKAYSDRVGFAKSAGLETAGAVGMAALLTKNPAFAAAMGLSKGLTVPQQIATGGVASGIGGAVAGAAESESKDLLGFTSDIAKRSIISSALGALTPAAISAGKLGIDVKRAMTEKGAIETAQESGLENLAMRLKMDFPDMSLDQIEDQLRRQLGKYPDPSNIALLQLMYERSPASVTAGFLRGQLMQESEAKLLANQHLKRMGDEGVSGLQKDTKSIFGGRSSFDDQLEALKETQRKNAQQAYGPAYANQNPIQGKEVDDLLSDPYTQKVLLPKARELFKIEKERAGGKGWDFPEVVTQKPTGRMGYNQALQSPEPEMESVAKIVPTTQLLHALRKVDSRTKNHYEMQALDTPTRDLLTSARESGFASKMESAIKAARKQNPAFDAATSRYKNDIDVQEAAEIGAKVFEYKDPEALKSLVKDMTPEAYAAYRQAAATQQMIRLDKLKEEGDASQVIKNMYNSQDGKKRLSTLFRDDPENFAQYLRKLKQQKIIAGSSGYVGIGSTTIENAKQETIANQIATGSGPSALGALLRLNPEPFIQSVAGNVLKKNIRTPQAVSAAENVYRGVIAPGRQGLENTFALMRRVENLPNERRMDNMRRAFPFLAAYPGLLSN